jgi:hypothetical protein
MDGQMTRRLSLALQLRSLLGFHPKASEIALVVSISDVRIVIDALEQNAAPQAVENRKEAGEVSPSPAVAAPRTEAFIAEWCQYSPDVDRFSELATFARQLEIELNQASDMARRWTELWHGKRRRLMDDASSP